MLKCNNIILFFFISASIIFPQNIHSSFNISLNDLAEGLDSDYTIIAGKEVQFLDLVKNILSEDVDLQLVDKQHRLDTDFIPHDIINLSDYPLHTRYKTMPFSKSTLKNFIKMSNTAKEKDVDLFIASTYRSYEFQDKIFTNMKNYHGEEKAATIVAYPGASQHQLGTAVDFGTITPGYANTDAGEWLLEHSWKYGFTLSYPKDMEHITSYMWEPWHYRYIGIYGAIVQRDFFSDSQHNFLLFWNKHKLLFINNLKYY